MTRGLLGVPGAIELVNPEPDRGLRSSLAIGLTESERRGAEGVCVVLVDMPGVTAAAVRAVTNAGRPGRVAMASYPDHSGHPTVMSPQLWREALAVAGPDEGARSFLAGRPDLVDLVPVTGDPRDIDTAADLQGWSV